MNLDAIRRQYSKNADQLAAMFAKAAATGRKVGGYTADELEQHAQDYARFARMKDADLLVHMGRAVRQ